MIKTIKCMFFTIIFILAYLWIYVHIHEWQSVCGEYVEKEVCVEQDSVRDFWGNRQITSISVNIDTQTGIGMGVVVYDDYCYRSVDVGLWNMICSNDDASIISVTLVRRGNRTAIVGYRWQNTDDNAYHYAETKDASLWWVKPKISFIECFVSLEPFKHPF